MSTPTVEKSEYYIRKSKEVHGDTFDYSLCFPIYRLHDKTKIICRKHGSFEQSMASHIHQQSICPKCSNSYRRSTEEVLVEIRETHGDKYEYAPFEYKSNKQQIKIVCKKHGEFEQGVKEHIKGSGCPRCKPNFKKTTETFIEAAKLKHGAKYDYSLVDYKGNDELVQIICKKHGTFQQTAHGHLCGYGCRRCSANSSKKENEWLDSLGIEGLIKQHRAKINGIIRVVDGFDPNTNTIYQFHGDYFHGNPKFYKPHWINAVSGKTFGELYKKTEEIKKMAEAEGYKYVEKWESDFKSKESKDFNYKPADYSKFEADMSYYMGYINQWRYADGEDFCIGEFEHLLRQAVYKKV